MQIIKSLIKGLEIGMNLFLQKSNYLFIYSIYDLLLFTRFDNLFILFLSDSIRVLSFSLSDSLYRYFPEILREFIIEKGCA